MADRLTRIYTKTGDKGSTSLANGERVSKCSARIEALGDIDELNCLLGVLVSQLVADHPQRELLQQIQNQLFDLGGELAVASPDYRAIAPETVAFLEQQLDQLNEQLPPLKEFILPGGSPAGAQCHLARAVCRRAERRLIALVDQEQQSTEGTRYLNRLSDLLFVCARVLAREGGGQEVLWQPTKRAQ